MTLGEWLTDTTRGRGWSQRTFAAKIEISATVATDILKKGQIAGDRILQRIADQSGVSMAFLDQLAGYSRREDPGIRGEATRLARLLANAPLYTENSTRSWNPQPKASLSRPYSSCAS